ncbi:unnamed protein product [Effrenium voratum]|nr:unnamed protein product [Effrenium voratum]
MKRIHACIRIQCFGRRIAAQRAYAEKLGAKANFVKLKRVTVQIQCQVRRWLAWRRVRDIRKVKYTPPVRILQKFAKGYLGQLHLMQQLRQAEPVQIVFHLNSSNKGKKIVPFTWKLAMLPVGEEGEIVTPEAWQARLELEKPKPKRSRRNQTPEAPLPPPPKSTDLFSKVGLKSLSLAAAMVIQETLRACMRGKKSRRALACAKEMAQDIAKSAAVELARRKAAAPKIQRAWRSHRTWIRRMERVRQEFRVRKRLVNAAATKIQALVRGVLARKHVRRLREETEWPLKGWFEYTGTGRNSVQCNVRFIPNTSFDNFRFFQKYGQPQTLLMRLQEMQQEIDNTLRAYLGPEEYAAMEARNATLAAAERAAEEAEREEQEVSAMAAAEVESTAINDVARAEEAAVRQEEERVAEALAEAARAAEEARQEEEASIGKVSEALANFTQAAAEIEVSPIQEAEAEERAAEEEEASATAEVEVAQPVPHLQEQQPAAAREAAAHEPSFGNAAEAQPVHVEQSVQLVQPAQPVQPAPASHLQDQQPAAREATVGQAADSAEAAQKSEVQALADEVAAVALQGFAQPADGKEAASAATTLQPVQEVPERSLQRKESPWMSCWLQRPWTYHRAGRSSMVKRPRGILLLARAHGHCAVGAPRFSESRGLPQHGLGRHRGAVSSWRSSRFKRLRPGCAQRRSGGSGAVRKAGLRHPTQRGQPLQQGQPKVFDGGEQRAPDLSSQTEAFQTRQRQSVQAAAMASTGLPRFLRPGLVDMAALNKLERTKMDLRFRRNRIGDQRREKYPIPSQVEYNRMNSTTQGVFHCHVHHHVHHNGMEKQIQPTSKPPDLWEGSGGEGREGREGATLEPLKEFQSKPKRLSKQGISKSAAEILRTAPAEYGPVGFAGPGLRKARRGASPARCKSEAKLAKA